MADGNMSAGRKLRLQERRYQFPYHYVPHFGEDGSPSELRSLSWGLEYLCYLHHVKERVESWNPQSVLDAGCGDGRLLGLLDEVPRRVGIDVSDRAIAFAKAFHPRVDFRVGDLAEVDEQFDVVTAVEVLEHISDAEVGRVVRGLEAAVAKGGRLVLSVPSSVLPLNPKHHRHYDERLLKEQVMGSSTHLRWIECGYVYREPLFVGWLRRLCHNRWWVVEIKFVKRILWSVIWRRFRSATEKDGRHLIAILRKE